MDASSPRCIQQLATSPKPLLTKPFPPSSLSPHSQLTVPSSFNSELDHSPIASHKAEEQSSCILSLPALPSTPPSLPSSIPTCVHTSPPHTPPPHTPPPHTTEPQSWVATLLKTKFYGRCSLHSGLRKNDQNLFCINHAEKICQYCHQADHPHKNTETPCTILHVSRYMYHDVLLAKEAASLLDITEVQSYLNNGNRVVYIDRRAQPKSKLAPHAKSCVICSRTLQDPYRFCSLFCRLQYANDPAAVETVPLPDASPLLHQVVKKVKKAGEIQNYTNTAAAKRLDRNLKRVDRSETSSPRIPSTSRSKAVKTKDVLSLPPLRLTAMKKRTRKAAPHRSPLSTATALMLSCGPLGAHLIYFAHEPDIQVMPFQVCTALERQGNEGEADV